MTSNDRNAREIFHFAKLALANVRLLADLEKARTTSTEIRNLVDKRMQEDSLLPPFSLLHQTTFLQFSYICLVWLWEHCKQHDMKDEVANLAGERFCFGSLMERIDGPRNVTDSGEVLRLVRNAISHGRVEVEEEGFSFKDQGWGENEFTSLSLGWDELAQLSEAVLSAVNDCLYPENEERPRC